MVSYLLLNDGVSRILLNDGSSKLLLNEAVPQQSDIIIRPYVGNWGEEPSSTSGICVSS